MDYWPLGPYRINAEKGNLYINNVKYTSPSGQVIENNTRKTYTFTFKVMSPEDRNKTTTYNLIGLFYLSLLSFAIIVLIKRGGIPEL